MSNRELAKTLIDQIPESKLYYVISYLQGVVVPDETPNEETIAAIKEVQTMITNGTGEHFDGSTSDFLAMLSEE